MYRRAVSACLDFALVGIRKARRMGWRANEVDVVCPTVKPQYILRSRVCVEHAKI